MCNAKNCNQPITLTEVNVVVNLQLVAFQDPTNLNGKVQKHQNFEQELNANKSRMEEITSTGQELIEAHHYATGI